MSLITNLSSTPTAQTATNVHPHGHKHGFHVDLTSDSTTTDSSAQVPVGTAQTLFGSLLQSLEQAIGIQPSTSSTTPAATTTSSSTTATAATTSSTAAPSANPTATQSAGTLLQNYLNNAAQNQKPDGLTLPNVAGNVRINV
jgi:hypothetical protein